MTLWLFTLIFSVRGWGPRNVPHGKSEALLHCDEKTWSEKAPESDKATSEPISCPLLRYITLPPVWDCHLRADLLEHGFYGNWALRPESSRDFLPRDLQRLVHHHLQSRWESFLVEIEPWNSLLEMVVKIDMYYLQRPPWRSLAWDITTSLPRGTCSTLC